MSSNHPHPDLSLPDLLALVDSLQQQLKDLSREVEAEENHVAQLEEMITKDQEKEARLRQDVNNISKELLEWEDRERFLAGAIDSNYKNYQVLQQMEVEGKTKLSQKRKKTDDLFKSLKAKFEVLQKKQEEDMKILSALPGYVEGKVLAEKKAKLAKIKGENRRLLEEFAGEKESNKKVWEDFQESCISLAEAGLEAKQKLEKLFSIREEMRRRSHTQPPTEDHVEEMETTEEEEEAGAGPSQEEMLVESFVPPEESREVSAPVLPPSQLLKIPALSPDPPRPSPELSPVPSLSLSLSAATPAVTPGPALPATPKTKTLQLGLGSSIMSSFRRGFREKDSPAKDVEMEDVGKISSVKSPECPQLNRSPVKTPKLKSFKLGLPSFLKKKPLQDQEVEGEARVVLPVTATNNNNIQPEPEQSQAPKKPVVTPTRARPSQGDSRTPRVLPSLPRLSLTKPVQKKEETEGRSSLDQLTISRKSLGQIALKKPLHQEKSLKVGQTEEGEDEGYEEDNQLIKEARPRTLLMLPNLPKLAGPRKPLAETLKEPKAAIAAAPEKAALKSDLTPKPKVVVPAATEEAILKSDVMQKPKVAVATATEEAVLTSDVMQKPMVAVAAATEEKLDPGHGVVASTPEETIESGGPPRNQGSPRQDEDQGSSVTSVFGSPEQGSFLVSPTDGGGFFSDLGTDFSAGFFGAGTDKEGGEDDGNFFGNFDEGEGGGFSFFGDSENKDTDADTDFFFRGEEKDDKEGGGFDFF